MNARRTRGRRATGPAAATILIGALLAPMGEASAQQRVLLPEGTVITVRTESRIDSETARQGQSFLTTVTDTIRVEGYTAIPAGSRVEGRVSLVRAASGQRSGVLGLDFTRLVLPDGRTSGIDGELTSTDPAERRRIEAQGDARVVLVGGREGIGAALGRAGAAEAEDPVAGVLGALGELLSEGRDVTVPAGSQLAVKLQRGVVLRATETSRRGPDAFTLYVSDEAIRAAQQALRQRGYFRGEVDGRLDERTQRALLEFQIDNDVLATGNLDGRTASLLGLDLIAPDALTAEEASLVRRDAQGLLRHVREHLAISANERLDPRAPYHADELELYFALSAFTDNAGLYERIVRSSGNVEGVTAAGEALLESAKRVDRALERVDAPRDVGAEWSRIREEIEPIASGSALR